MAMIKILGEIPKDNLAIALSGGIDSMTIAYFLLRGKRKFTALHFNHGTPHGDVAAKFVHQWCQDNDVPLESGHIDDIPNDSEMYYNGRQDYYRLYRYIFLSKFNDKSIITAHHLDDVLETWLFSTFNGHGKLIPYRKNNFIRPFLLTPKKTLVSYAERNNVSWVEDDSNSRDDYMRNIIRNNIVPQIERVNKGIRKIISRKVEDMYERYLDSEKNYWKYY